MGKTQGVAENVQRSTRASSPAVVLAEGSAVLRAAVREYLSHHGQGLEVVSEASSSAEVIAQVQANSPDVVVLDLHLGDGGGWAPERGG